MVDEGLLHKLYLVTGGGSGIGRAICQSLSRKGASVAVADINLLSAQETVITLKEIATQAGHKDSSFLAYKVDVSKSDEVKDMMVSISKDFSLFPLSGLVNNAGIANSDSLINMKEEEFDNIITVNVKGAFILTQAAVKVMLEQKVKNASIVNISSVSAKFGVFGATAYGASKGALQSMTLAWTRELRKYGIRCNAIVPGLINTPMSNSTLSVRTMQNVIKVGSLRRIGQPEEVAELCSFLLSERSSYITGSFIDISGGLLHGYL